MKIARKQVAITIATININKSIAKKMSSISRLFLPVFPDLKVLTSCALAYIVDSVHGTEISPHDAEEKTTAINNINYF